MSMTPFRRAAETANPKADRLAEALEGLLSALSPLTVMGHPIASLDDRLARAINVAVPLLDYARMHSGEDQ